MRRAPARWAPGAAGKGHPSPVHQDLPGCLFPHQQAPAHSGWRYLRGPGTARRLAVGVLRPCIPAPPGDTPRPWRAAGCAPCHGTGSGSVHAAARSRTAPEEHACGLRRMERHDNRADCARFPLGQTPGRTARWTARRPLRPPAARGPRRRFSSGRGLMAQREGLRRLALPAGTTWHPSSRSSLPAAKVARLGGATGRTGRSGGPVGPLWTAGSRG